MTALMYLLHRGDLQVTEGRGRYDYPTEGKLWKTTSLAETYLSDLPHSEHLCLTNTSILHYRSPFIPMALSPARETSLPSDTPSE